MCRTIPRLLGDLRDLLERLDDAGLVVGVHHADEDGVFVDALGQCRDVHDAVCGHRAVGHPEALALQSFAGVKDRVMLDGGSDDVIALVTQGMGHAS